MTSMWVSDFNGKEEQLTSNSSLEPYQLYCEAYKVRLKVNRLRFTENVLRRSENFLKVKSLNGILRAEI